MTERRPGSAAGSALTPGMLPPFFIVGCPRSGTTLTAQLLDNHPRMAVFVESLYYPLFRADLHLYGDLRRANNLRLLIENFRKMVSLGHLFRVEPPTTQEIQDALPRPTFEAVLCTFLQLYGLRLGKPRCGEKTAQHHEYVVEIRARIPDSPVIFVMRDPRDTVLSLRKMFDMRLDAAIAMWRHAYRNYERVSDAVLLLRYEDLVRTPHETLDRLCAALGDKYEADMLDFFRHVPDGLRSASHHRKLTGAIDPATVGAFRTMPFADVERIEANCAYEMDALGYSANHARALASRPLSPRRAPRSARSRTLVATVDRYWRLIRRPDLLRLGWKRWKMRMLVRLRYALTFGPVRSRPHDHPSD